MPQLNPEFFISQLFLTAYVNSLIFFDKTYFVFLFNQLKKSGLDLPIVPFTPQPYRITIKLSGANPSAPAETVTNALRKAGVQFEVEKIERFDEEKFLKDTSMKR